VVTGENNSLTNTSTTQNGAVGRGKKVLEVITLERGGKKKDEHGGCMRGRAKKRVATDENGANRLPS